MGTEISERPRAATIDNRVRDVIDNIVPRDNITWREEFPGIQRSACSVQLCGAGFDRPTSAFLT